MTDEQNDGEATTFQELIDILALLLCDPVLDLHREEFRVPPINDGNDVVIFSIFDKPWVEGDNPPAKLYAQAKYVNGQIGYVFIPPDDFNRADGVDFNYVIFHEDIERFEVDTENLDLALGFYPAPRVNRVTVEEI